MKQEKARETATVLTDFVNNYYWGQFLSEQESKRNIEDGLIKIETITAQGNGIIQSISQGLLITDDGYFITARHCLDYHFDFGFIENKDGRFRIEGVKAQTHPKYDLLLAKADIPVKCKARRYKIGGLSQNSEKKVFTLRRYDKEIQSLINRIMFFGQNVMCGGNFKHIDQLILFCLDGEKGDSGGPVMDDCGNLLGFVNGGNERAMVASASKINYAMELITVYAQHLKHKYEV